MNMILAAFCVILFSLSMPTTRVAALAFDPSVVALLRLIGAGVVCLVSVAAFDRWVPPRRAWGPLAATAMGSVAGFSLLSAFAMERVPAIHGAIALAALPAATAAYASLRDRLNPGARFWMFCAAGTGLTFGFFSSHSGQAGAGLRSGDWILGAAILSAAFGYVEGGRLSREHGGRRVMSWAVLLALPLALLASWPVLKGARVPSPAAAPSAWLSVLYLATVSQSLGMFLWFQVLARGPMAKIALVQLIQPFFSLVAAMLLLGESPDGSTWVIAGLVAICVLGANRAREPTGPAAAASPPSPATAPGLSRA